MNRHTYTCKNTTVTIIKMADILMRVSRCPRMLKALNKLADEFGRGHATNQS